MSKTNMKKDINNDKNNTVVVDAFNIEQFNKDYDEIIAALNDVMPDKWYAYLESTIRCRITSIDTTKMFITNDGEQLETITTDNVKNVKKAYSSYVVKLQIVEGIIPEEDADGIIEIRKPLNKWAAGEGYTVYKGCSYYLVKDIVSATRKNISKVVGEEILITPRLYTAANGKTYINHDIERAE